MENNEMKQFPIPLITKRNPKSHLVNKFLSNNKFLQNSNSASSQIFLNDSSLIQNRIKKKSDLFYNTSNSFNILSQTNRKTPKKANMTANNFYRTMSALNFKQNKNPNVDLVNSFSKYIDKIEKESQYIKKIKKPNHELMKKILNKNKSDSDLFTKTFKDNFIESKDFQQINNIYQDGHRLENKLMHNDYMNIVERDEKLNSKYKQEIFNNLSQDELKFLDMNKNNTFYFDRTQKKYISRTNKTETLMNNSNVISNQKSSFRDTSNQIQLNYQIYYKDQYDSYSLLKLNKNLQNEIQMKVNEEQIKNYMSKHFKYEEQKLKLILMPKVKPIPMTLNVKNDSQEQSLYGDELSTNKDINSGTRLSDLAFNQRKILFTNYKAISVKEISNFLITPTSRKGHTMIRYYDDIIKENKLILFGGMNISRLNELWELLVIKITKGIKKYKWKEITDIKGDIPLPREGHSCCLFRNELIIYGGCIENEKVYHYKDDILLFDINQKKWSSEICSNKSGVTWRKYHIAEMVGQYMLIYGGVNDDGDILSDPWILDVMKLRWIQGRFKDNSILPKMYHMCSATCIPTSKVNNPKFNFFKANKKVQNFSNINIKYEGIYLFGGINDQRKVTNDIFVIMQGKPLTMIKPYFGGEAPAPRCECSMKYFEKLNVLIVYGGRNEYDLKGPFYNDFFFLDMERLNWIRLETNKDIVIQPRGGHCAEIVDNEMIIFGGLNEKYFHKSNLLICNLDIVEVGNNLRMIKMKKDQKNKKSEDEENDINQLLNNKENNKENKAKKKTMELEKQNEQFMELNSQIKNAQAYFDRFPQEKMMLQKRFDEIEKISFNNISNGVANFMKNNA